MSNNPRSDDNVPLRGRPNYQLPFMNTGASPSGNSRKETLWDMVKFVCCPGIKLQMFVVIITFIDIAMFIIELIYGGIDVGKAFLQPRQVAFIDLGGKYPFFMRYRFQIWRFITPVLLHSNFSHILYNMISQLIFGVSMEQMVGPLKIALVYIASGIGGNLFSSLLTSELSVGASTAVFGLLGSQLAFLFLNWKAFDYQGSGRDKYLCIILMLILFNFLFGFQGGMTDTLGHLGGLLVGVFMGLWIFEPIRRNESYEKTAKIIGIVCTAIFFVLGFILFYTVVKPLPLMGTIS